MFDLMGVIMILFVFLLGAGISIHLLYKLIDGFIENKKISILFTVSLVLVLCFFMQLDANMRKNTYYHLEHDGKTERVNFVSHIGNGVEYRDSKGNVHFYVGEYKLTRVE